jgi:hypothetical protein
MFSAKSASAITVNRAPETRSLPHLFPAIVTSPRHLSRLGFSMLEYQNAPAK